MSQADGLKCSLDLKRIVSEKYTLVYENLIIKDGIVKCV